MSNIISMQNGTLVVPDEPVIPFIEGDGIGPDIWKAASMVLDAAVAKAYGGKKKIQWMEVLAGEKAFTKTGSWLPDETLEAFRKYIVGIKGPLTTPVGGGMRSLNVTLRQILDLYVCLRPVKYYDGIPSPVKHPELVNMVIFRENTEDVYAGFEKEASGADANKIIDFLKKEFGWDIRPDSGIGIKPVSLVGSKRLIKAAIEYAITAGRKSVTLVHKGNIMKYTEGAFMKWGYELAKEAFPNQVVSWAECEGKVPEGKILIKDCIADAFLQQILTRPAEYDVIATLNLNGDYVSDALAAQVGGIGIAPGANINYEKGWAIFEATHGTAPKYKDLDMANPSSVILSGMMMLEYMGWKEAADLVEKGLIGALASKKVTYDFARLMDGSTKIPCSAFGQNMIDHM